MSPADSHARRITILLVDDHLVVRQGLRMLLENHPDLAIVGETDSWRGAVDLARRERPEIVLLDLDLGREQGIDGVPELAAVSGRVLVLTGVRDSALHQRAIRLGAAGVVLKHHAAELLVKAVRRVHAGDVWVDHGTTTALWQQMRDGADDRPPGPEAARLAELTNREREIVALIAQGLGTQPLADALGISEKTIRNHLLSIYGKLQVSSRLELALFAARHGLG